MGKKEIAIGALVVFLGADVILFLSVLLAPPPALSLDPSLMPTAEYLEQNYNAVRDIRLNYPQSNCISLTKSDISIQDLQIDGYSIDYQISESENTEYVSYCYGVDNLAQGLHLAVLSGMNESGVAFFTRGQYEYQINRLSFIVHSVSVVRFLRCYHAFVI